MLTALSTGIKHNKLNFMKNRTVLLIMNFNGTSMTVDLLASLAKIHFQHDVWVYDNGSQNDDTQTFRETFPNVQVIRSVENHGFAGGVNRAVACAAADGYDYAYVINNDTLAFDDFLSPCIAIMDVYPDVDIVGSRVLLPDLKTGEFTRWGYHSSPNEAKSFPDGFLETRQVLGCGMLLRISTYQKLGGLDERFFCYFEENDYCFRVTNHKHRLGMAADSLIIHKDKGTDDGIWTRYFYGRNTLLFSRLHDSSILNCAHTIIYRCLLRGWKDIFCGQFKKTAAVGHGFADALRRRFGKRTMPFGTFSGLFYFVTLNPLVFLYALYIHPKFNHFPRSTSHCDSSASTKLGT